MVQQLGLEPLGAQPPVEPQVLDQSELSIILTDQSELTLTRKLATFWRPLLDIQPDSLSSRMLASTNGTPVLPSAHASNFFMSLNVINFNIYVV